MIHHPRNFKHPPVATLITRQVGQFSIAPKCRSWSALICNSLKTRKRLSGARFASIFWKSGGRKCDYCDDKDVPPCAREPVATAAPVACAAGDPHRGCGAHRTWRPDARATARPFCIKQTHVHRVPLHMHQTPDPRLAALRNRPHQPQGFIALVPLPISWGSSASRQEKAGCIGRGSGWGREWFTNSDRPLATLLRQRPFRQKSRWSLHWPDLNRQSRRSPMWPPLLEACAPNLLACAELSRLSSSNLQPSRDGLPSPSRSAEATNINAPARSPVPASLFPRHFPCQQRLNPSSDLMS
jgi:hypothetical protein